MLSIPEELIHEAIDALSDRVGSSNFQLRAKIWKEIRWQEYRDDIIGKDVFTDITEILRNF